MSIVSMLFLSSFMVAPVIGYAVEPYTPTSNDGFTEGFENGSMPPPGGWSIINTNPIFNWWIIDNSSNPDWIHSGVYSAWVNYDFLNYSYQDEWLISPDINLSGYVQATLAFWAISDTNFSGATVELHIRGEGFDNIIWDMIQDENWTSSFTYRELTFDLSSYIGQTINISWRYVGIDGQSFGLDDISINLSTTSEETIIYLQGESPTNNSTGISINQPTVSVNIDAIHVSNTVVDGYIVSSLGHIPFNWTIEGQYIQPAGANDDTAGTKTTNLITPLPYSTQITWYVNVTANGVKENKVFHFTTEEVTIYIEDESPANNSMGINIGQSTVSVNIDAEVALTPIPFNWTIEGNYVQAAGANGASAGTKTANLTSLPYSTQIVWYVNVTANGVHRNEIFHFTTEAPPNQPPTFGAPDPVNGSTNQPRAFSWNISINDAEGDAFNWTIQCSNGQQAGANGATNGTKTLVLSSLNHNETYFVRVNATDVGGSKTTRAIYHFRTLENKKPIVNFTSRLQDLTVTFNSSLSKDPDGSIVNWTWNFGDINVSYQTNPTHKYGSDGNYQVILTLRDNDGATNSTTNTVIVKNNPPVADFVYAITAGTKHVRFDASNSSDVNGTIVSYFWEFGDGTNSTTTDVIVSHDYAQDYRTYKVNLTVKDSAGLPATKSKDVPIADVTAPTIKITKPAKRTIYTNNQVKRQRFFGMPIIFGDISIEVNATDGGSGMAKVDFYINGGKPKGNDTVAPYNYTWKKDRLRLFHVFTIKVVAYDKAGNSATDKIVVRKYL